MRDLPGGVQVVVIPEQSQHPVQGVPHPVFMLHAHLEGSSNKSFDYFFPIKKASKVLNEFSS
jgi:hypothetical protein